MRHGRGRLRARRMAGYKPRMPLPMAYVFAGRKEIEEGGGQFGYGSVN